MGRNTESLKRLLRDEGASFLFVLPLQTAKASSSRVGSSAVNKLVGESRVTAHVRSIANIDLYSSVVVKTVPPGFNSSGKSSTLGRLPWAEHPRFRQVSEGNVLNFAGCQRCHKYNSYCTLMHVVVILSSNCLCSIAPKFLYKVCTNIILALTCQSF